MATTSFNRPWNLQAFLDSLVIELDKAQDTLAVKALTRPLSYTVKDVDLEVQVFPQFDGQRVRFVTAQPGQTGASGLKLQLGSITARTIKETAPEPIRKDDVAIDTLDIDEEAKQSLRKLGVNSARDLERIEEQDVDLEKVTDRKLDYGTLANMINKARRRTVAPTVTRVGMSKSLGAPVLALQGSNLVVGRVPEFPIALLDGERVEVLSASENDVRIKVDPSRLAGRASKLELALDPFAILAIELKA